MEQEKYFVPEISDIRVGYECEFQINKKNDQWRPFTFKKSDLFECSICNGEKVNEKDCELRTPYLTKEQIKAEEWKKSDHSWIIPDFEKSEEDEWINLFEKGEFRLYFNNQTRHVSIHRSEEPLFSGILPSINEFRFINKLLGI